MTRWVCIVGTDGSGKTTLSARLVEQLRESGVDVRHEWLGAESYLMAPLRKVLKLVWGRRRRLTTGSGGSRTNVAGDTSGAPGYRGEIARKNAVVKRYPWAIQGYIFLVLLDYRLQLRRKLHRARDTDLVVADRYVFDVAVNLGLTLGWDPAFLVRFLQQQMTRVRLPDVRVFLRVEPEVSLARKDDIPDADYLGLRLAYYDAVAAAFGFEVRDGTRPIEETSSWLLQLTQLELAKPHVHYVHSNNHDVGGADKVLVRMAEHMGSRAAERPGGFRVSVSLRLATDVVELHEAAGTPVLLRGFERPQLSAGLPGLIRFGLAGPHTFLYFRRLFALQQPDLVHVNDVYDFLPALAARRAGIPVVYHLRMFQGRPRVRTSLAWLIAWSSQASVAVSDAVRQHYFPRPVRGHRAEMVHDLGDVDLMADQGNVLLVGPRPDGVPDGGRLVTMVGRVEELKGQAVFLDAVEALKPSVRECGTFVLVGGSVPGKEAYFDEILRRARVLGVTMLGFRRDVPAFLRASDVSVHCSTEPDSFPGVVVESLLAGTALVGARVGGVPEMVSELGQGVLVSPGDADVLAAAIADLIEAVPTPRSRFAAAARARGLALVDPAPIDEQTRALYTAVLAARGRSAQ
ncbi:glycosyltransferase [Streptomyces sp900116325]|uniref:D-inositol 3-phosphate glycosyltransferase n=1 Tax=Streptomyces sp. 900116325 TaxID=3154295 RepID=A0ABV2U8D5_9ACTN